MIFLTVGTQLPFDRMVGAVDTWAARTGEKVVAQVGPTNRHYPHLSQFSFMEPVVFDQHLAQARLVIAHAGMGSIIGAMTNGKPLVLVPRKASLGEHRNDHQMATAKQFARFPGIAVVWHEAEIESALDQAIAEMGQAPQAIIADTAPADFLARLRALIGGQGD